MYYIKSASTISHQPSFRNNFFSENIEPLSATSKLFTPDYKEFINPVLLRRMSEILRMSIACSLDCLNQSEIKEAGAIIVGTGLGCLFDTEKFLNNALTIEGGMLPPTSFIQSTHNTVAGQISLVMGNHHYNMTHTQNSVSFEHALIDAFLCLNEGEDNILVGAADEYIEQLDPIVKDLGFKNLTLTSGTSFFLLSNQKDKQSTTRIIDAKTYAMMGSLEECITDFLFSNKIAFEKIDMILLSGGDNKIIVALQKWCEVKLIVDYLKYCGLYFTSAAFALHLAIDILKRNTHSFENSLNKNGTIKRILICNNLNPEHIGLTIIESIEA